LAVVSALVVFASIAVFATLYSSADRQTAVLIAAQTIQKGQRFSGSMLGQASVAVSGGLTPIPVSEAAVLAGKRAAVTVPAGSLLTSADVTAAAQVAPGYAVVGISLKVGQLPAGGLATGDQVMIVQTAGPGAALAAPSGEGAGGAGGDAAASTGVLVPQASVFDVEQPPSDSSSDVAQLVSVEVSSTLAAAVSTAAAADQATLVLLPDGSGTDGTGAQPTRTQSTAAKGGSVPAGGTEP
jgi:hypothetical protein